MPCSGSARPPRRECAAAAFWSPTAGALRGYHLPPATRAGLLRRLGRTTKAAASYREALELAATDAERRYLATPKPPKPGHRQTRSPQPPLRRKINPLQMLTPFTWHCILMM
jgi:hypothetical protein